MANQNNYFQQRLERSKAEETSQDPSTNSTTNSSYQAPQNGLTLEDLKTMFKADIDAEVVEMIWQDCNENCDTALGFLTEMSPRAVPIAAAVKTSSLWSNVLGADTSKPFIANQGVKPKANIKTKHWAVDGIKQRINNNEKILIIMRGVPGTGKSYLARQLRGNGVVLSTDDFFINYQGQYVFDRYRLPEAHEWNQKRADQKVRAGTNPIVIDNTNLEVWEMQPYVMMALRHNYSVELVEPDTPWREDARILAQKNTHHVPREKIRDMLEKQKVKIDINMVIENSRKKMNPSSYEGTAVLSASTGATVNQSNATLSHFEQLSSREWTSRDFSMSSFVAGSRDWQESQPVDKNLPLPTGFQPDGNVVPYPAVNSQSPDVLASTDAGINFVAKPSTCEVSIQTSLSESEPPLRELTTRSRSIQSSRLVPDYGKKPTSTKLSLDKGCLTDEIVEELATREALAVLKSYFPTKETGDLADILKQCNGDLTWTVNVLLDSGYECANEVPDNLQLEDEYQQPEENHQFEDNQRLEEEPSALNNTNIETLSSMNGEQAQAKDDETSSFTSEASQQSLSAASTTSEESKALKKHIEDCFQLTDTISEQTRRICGKDYNQFRASQLQKLRTGQSQVSEVNLLSENQTKNVDSCDLSLASFPTLGEQITNEFDSQPETNNDNLVGLDLLQLAHAVSPPLSEEEVKVDEEAKISMTLDPTFVQQLVNLFGAPDLKGKRPTNNQSNLTSFDIPWSLAEQIYLHWCSSLISKDEESLAVAEDDRRELQNIMDFELAMQLVQDERNAERKELRESLSTKLSFQMLQENYPYVDPLALDALFEANNYNYSHTVTALNASLGTKPQQPKVQTTSSNQPVAREEIQPRTPKREMKTESRDLRTEAFLYNRLRQQYSAQAQEYHQRGMSAAAMYYSKESRRYAELYKKANQQAALQIVEEKNAHHDERTIDLHELHVVEALTCLESFIVENVRDGKNVVQVITGRGNNSQSGRPRIKPAVITFLKQKKYGFEEVNPGMLRVFLSRTMTRRVPL